MVEIELASGRDFAFWMSMDKGMDDTEVRHLICNKRCYIIRADSQNVGIIRYGLFRDDIPILNHIYLEEKNRRKGIGSQAVAQWEKEMNALGYPCVITSTREEEATKVFYMKQGYKAGGYLAEIPCIGNPREVFYIKEFKPALRVVGR